MVRSLQDEGKTWKYLGCSCCVRQVRGRGRCQIYLEAGGGRERVRESREVPEGSSRIISPSSPAASVGAQQPQVCTLQGCGADLGSSPGGP